MKNALLFLLFCLLPLEVFGRQEASSRQTALVFTHVTVIDATGAPAKPDMTVVIKGGRIAALGKTAKLDVPENAQVVDATGKFLIPGLWDMHIHPINKKDYLGLFIANGVTGMRVMWGWPKHQEWRKEISAGELIGPRMVISSPIIGFRPGDFPAGNDEDEGRQVVRKVKKEGADLVKVYNFIPRDAYFAIADEAKKQGIPFAGHVPYLVSAAEASDAGQQSIEHCYFVLLACSSRSEEELKKKLKETWDTRPMSLPHVRARVKQLADITYSEKKAAELFARFVKNSTWVCPTIMFYHGLSFRDKEDLANDPRFKYIPLSTKDSWKNDVHVALGTGEGRADFRKICEKNLAIVSAMRDAGVGLLAGTDTYTPGFGLQDELALFVQAGLSPLEALQTATYNAAKCLGKLDSMGTVERGKVADLVLLDANPLQDISNTQKIAAVVVGGKIFDRAALQKMLAQVKASRLHDAAADGEIEQVKLLIAEGADVNAKDKGGYTPLYFAIWNEDKDTIRLLVAKGADVNAKDNRGYTALYHAIWSKNKDTVRLLVSRGADVNFVPKDDYPALHYVIWNDDVESAKLFINYGARFNVKDQDGRTAFRYAVSGGNRELLEFLVAKGADVSDFHLAAWLGDLTRVKCFVEQGTDVNTKDDELKWAPLHWVAFTEHQDVVEFLLAKGASVNAKDDFGGTPLQYAAGAGESELVELLLAKGAKVNAIDKWDSTPLHAGAGRGHEDVVELLIANGANVNAKDGQGKTPLHGAARKGHKAVVEMLVKKGADVNAKGNRDRTPLWYAKDKGHNEIVELLRKHGAKE